MSITIPTLTITTGACGSGLPPTIAPFTGLVATTVSLREVTTINAALVEYIVIAAFPTAEINFLTTEIGPECSTVNTFTFSTAGPLSFIESLQALLPAASTTSPFPGVAPPIPTAAFTTSHAATPTTPPPKSIISSGAAAGLAVGCLLAGALLALLGAFLLFKRRQRRAPAAAAAAAGPRGYVDAADEAGRAGWRAGGGAGGGRRRRERGRWGRGGYAGDEGALGMPEGCGVRR